jgi:predicted  nucleic acid-binding Zn-ribbon protein
LQKLSVENQDLQRVISNDFTAWRKEKRQLEEELACREEELAQTIKSNHLASIALQARLTYLEGIAQSKQALDEAYASLQYAYEVLEREHQHLIKQKVSLEEQIEAFKLSKQDFQSHISSLQSQVASLQSAEALVSSARQSQLLQEQRQQEQADR